MRIAFLHIPYPSSTNFILSGKSDQYLNKRLWTPKAFMKDFKNSCADLVNTLTGRTVPNQPLEWFWRGFSSVTQRLVDSQELILNITLFDYLKFFSSMDIVTGGKLSSRRGKSTLEGVKGH